MRAPAPGLEEQLRGRHEAETDSTGPRSRISSYTYYIIPPSRAALVVHQKNTHTHTHADVGAAEPSTCSQSGCLHWPVSCPQAGEGLQVDSAASLQMMWVCFDMSRSRFFFNEKCGKVEVLSQKIQQMMMRSDQSEGCLEEATQKIQLCDFFFFFLRQLVQTRHSYIFGSGVGMGVIEVLII